MNEVKRVICDDERHMYTSCPRSYAGKLASNEIVTVEEKQRSLPNMWRVLRASTFLTSPDPPLTTSQVETESQRIDTQEKRILVVLESQESQ